MRKLAPSFVVLALGCETVLLVLAYLLGGLLGLRPFGHVGLSWPGVVLGIVGTVPLLGLLRILLRSPTPRLVRLRATVAELLGPLLVRSSVAELAIAAGAAGVVEEALFRGVIQVSLAPPLGAVGAVLATSTLFGLAHLVTPLYAALAGAIGAYLGLLFVLTGNLMVPILVHGLYDLVALAALAAVAKRRATGSSGGAETL